MLITTAQLQKEKLTLNETLPEGTIDYTPDTRQVGGLLVTGQAELLEEHRGQGLVVDDIRIRGRVQGQFEQLCARCLDPVPETVDVPFDLIYRPAGVDAESGEHAITEEETEIGYYEGSGLLLEDAIREQVLLTLPGRALCREDCQGLSSKDGSVRTLAEGEEPEESTTDPRWSALAGIDVKAKG